LELILGRIDCINYCYYNIRPKIKISIYIICITRTRISSIIAWQLVNVFLTSILKVCIVYMNIWVHKKISYDYITAFTCYSNNLGGLNRTIIVLKHIPRWMIWN
jgi:hypothetical protein